MKFIFISFIVSIITLLSCSEDICEITPYEDPIKYLSITGRVINPYDNEGIEGVRLSMLDQIGGSFIIQWDSTQVSHSNGCFKYEEERDLDFLTNAVAMDPSMRLEQINQSLRPIDDRYYYLKSQQGNDDILSFTRWQYNSGLPVEMYVVPAATVTFNYDTNSAERSFRWSFIESSLLSYNTIGSFRIDPDIKWKIPADRDIRIEVLDESQSVIYMTELLANPGEPVTVSF